MHTNLVSVYMTIYSSFSVDDCLQVYGTSFRQNNTVPL